MDFDHDVICVQVAAVVCRQKQPFPRSETAAYGSLLHGSHYHLQPRLQLHFVCVGLILIFFNGDEFISHLYVVDLILLLILRVFYQTSMLPSSTSIFSFFCPKVSNCYWCSFYICYPYCSKPLSSAAGGPTCFLVSCPAAKRTTPQGWRRWPSCWGSWSFPSPECAWPRYWSPPLAPGGTATSGSPSPSHTLALKQPLSRPMLVFKPLQKLLPPLGELRSSPDTLM